VLQILAEHYPPEPLLNRATIGELQALVEDAGAHPERFEAERYS
jgi:hypothetical protein